MRVAKIIAAFAVSILIFTSHQARADKISEITRSITNAMGAQLATHYTKDEMDLSFFGKIDDGHIYNRITGSNCRGGCAGKNTSFLRAINIRQIDRIRVSVDEQLHKSMTRCVPIRVQLRCSENERCAYWKARVSGRGWPKAWDRRGSVQFFFCKDQGHVARRLATDIARLASAAYGKQIRVAIDDNVPAFEEPKTPTFDLSAMRKELSSKLSQQVRMIFHHRRDNLRQIDYKGEVDANNTIVIDRGFVWHRDIRETVSKVPLRKVGVIHLYSEEPKHPATFDCRRLHRVQLVCSQKQKCIRQTKKRKANGRQYFDEYNDTHFADLAYCVPQRASARRAAELIRDIVTELGGSAKLVIHPSAR